MDFLKISLSRRDFWQICMSILKEPSWTEKGCRKTFYAYVYILYMSWLEGNICDSLVWRFPMWWFIELYSCFFLQANQWASQRACERTNEGVQGRSASSPPASARWSPPRPPCGRRAAWRVGSQGRRGHPAKPSTPVSAASLSTCSTWEDHDFCDTKYGLKELLNEI